MSLGMSVPLTQSPAWMWPAPLDTDRSVHEASRMESLVRPRSLQIVSSSLSVAWERESGKRKWCKRKTTANNLHRNIEKAGGGFWFLIFGSELQQIKFL